MRVVALDVADESDTAGIFLEVVYIETLTCGESGVPRLGVALDSIEAILGINL